MEKIKIGILGCASIAYRSTIPAILNLSDLFELVFVCSRTLDKAKQFSDRFSCKAVVGYENIWDEEFDALYIPLPTGLHLEWIVKGLEAGKHIYAEKSIVFSLDDAKSIVSTARRDDLALMEGYMFLYHTQHKIIKDLMSSNEIGEIRSFSSSFSFPPLDTNNFRYDLSVGGGALFDAAGYPLKAVSLILGESYRVTSSTLHYDDKTGVCIYGSAFLSNRDENGDGSRSGVGATINFGFDNFYQCYYQIVTSRCKITVERAFTPPATLSPKIVIEESGKEDRVIYANPCNHFEKAMVEFSRCIQTKEVRDRHYGEILSQARDIEDIIILNKL